MPASENRKANADWLKRRPADKRDRPFFWDDPQWNVANCPVVGVTWFEAEAYCLWLNEKLKGQLPPGWVVRLPTEAEWEKAARRPPPISEATPSPAPEKHGAGEGALWPWGDVWDAERCNSEESKFYATTPVGMYPNGATADSVEDMIGNVWEWCLDGWDVKAYEKHSAKDPFVPSGAARVLRGGSLFSNRRICRAAYRDGFGPTSFSSRIGFRPVLSPVPHET